MNKRPTKRELRQQLSNEMQRFINQGGQVTEVSHGASGLVDGRYGQPLGFERPKEERTPLNDVLKTIDQRREDQRKRAKPTPPKRGPRKKVIYDDFGEPLRIIWEED